MSKVEEFSQPSPPESLGLSKEDWLLLDEALNRLAKSLRRIEREEQLKKLQGADDQPPVDP